MTHAPHTKWLYRVVMVLVVLIVPLHAKRAAADETAAKCCDQSSMECNTGQTVGDKGSCPGSQVCVQFVDKCKKKSPGVLCMCGDKTSSLGLSSTNLTFTKKSRRAVLTVSNTGNVPLDITILESGDTEAFDIRATRRCKKKITSPAAREEFPALLASPSTATVPPQGCLSYRVRFTAKKEGVYSEQLDIQSDAIQPPTEAAVTLTGSVGHPGTSTTTTTPSNSTTTTLGSSGPPHIDFYNPNHAPPGGSFAIAGENLIGSGTAPHVTISGTAALCSGNQMSLDCVVGSATPTGPGSGVVATPQGTAPFTFTVDPTVSRRSFKRDIAYLSTAETTQLYDELLRFRLATYRYKAEDQCSTAPHLGFIIDDVGSSPAVGPDGDHVDLYGYSSMAVAAIQTQAKQIEQLQREVAALRRTLRSRRGAHAP